MAANKGGRPTKFTQEIAEGICERIASSNDGLSKICKEFDVSTVTVFAWLKDNAEFLNTYTRAREAQADFLADEIIEIADDSRNDTVTIMKGDTAIEIENKEWTSRSKLRVEARKWVAAKLKPKKYGDKIDVTTDGDKITTQKETFITLSNGTKIPI